MRGIFVTGTDTNVGKTLVCATLMAGAPKHWRYWKPVQTGLAVDEGDTATVQKRALVPPERAPDVGLRLPLAASPHYAAQALGVTIDVQALAVQGKSLSQPQDFWLIEGAGGILTPLNDTHTMLDFAQALHWPVLIVVRSRLGAISHALLTERALHAAGQPALGFVLSGQEDPSLETALTSHSRLPVIGRLPELPAHADLTALGALLRQALLEHLP